MTLPPNAGSLRSCLGRFATGVVVVSFDGQDGPRGITVNSFTSVSVDPPLVLVSVARRARAHDLLIDAPFCVNVLAAEQEQIAERFAGSGDGPVHWVPDSQVPRLAGVLAHLECRPWRHYDGGDHTLFLGQVTDFAYRDGDALAFHTSRFTAIVDEQLGIEGLIQPRDELPGGTYTSHMQVGAPALRLTAVAPVR